MSQMPYNYSTLVFTVIRTFRKGYPLFKKYGMMEIFSYEVEMALQ